MATHIFELDKVAEGKLDAMVNKVHFREELPDRMNKEKVIMYIGRLLLE